MPPPMLRYPWRPGEDAAALRQREWLVTNGLGGFAAGTLLNVPTRRYHGLLTASLPHPFGRILLVPRLDETIHIDGHPVRLGGTRGAIDADESDAVRYLAEVRREWDTPVWTFRIEGRTIERRIVMPHELNTVLVHYRLLQGEPVRLDLRPYVSFRAHEGPLEDRPEWPFALVIERGRHDVRPFEGAPPLRLAVHPHGAPFLAKPRTSRNVYYPVEHQRGLETTTDLHSPGRFTLGLDQGADAAFVASTEPWETLTVPPEATLEAERRRLERVLAAAPEPARRGSYAQLVVAADQFLVQPGARREEEALARAGGEELRTVVAGYHWFTDWGRDTMISLEGLTLATGRYREARALLLTFARYLRDGLIPNRFPETRREALYNTADATLWFYHALDRYYRATTDRRTLAELLPPLADAARRQHAGTRHGIRVDPRDGLLIASDPDAALTWMDAQVEDWIVTPRRGKPVEIQALWYNALRLLDEWARDLGLEPGPFAAWADQARDSFNKRFWDEHRGHLLDVVDGEEGDDARLRPNQVFALSIRHPVLEEERWTRVLEVVTQRLLTPFGLRTLDPANEGYRPYYEGNRWTRDASYHQGLVWPWLIGAYVDAWRRVHPHEAPPRALWAALEDHLQEGVCPGTVPECFDAEPPHQARGCAAQAWSVAELLRVSLTAAPEA
jgi:predicted glycogen debranching enzyme